jgi:hypothetical protein
VTKVVKPAEVAVASACLQFWSIFGGACGAAFSTLIYSNVGNLDVKLLGDREDQAFKDDLLRGLRASHWFWAGLCFFGKSWGSSVADEPGGRLGFRWALLANSAAIMTMILLRDSDASEALEAEDNTQAESNPQGDVAMEKAKESLENGSGKPDSQGMDVERR